MKRFLAIMLAAMIILCSFMAAFAEDTANSTADQPPQMGDSIPEGTPPEMPEGGFSGNSGMGTPPEKPMGSPAGLLLTAHLATAVSVAAHLPGTAPRLSSIPRRPR